MHHSTDSIIFFANAVGKLNQDDIHCADCGNKVLMHVPENENEDEEFGWERIADSSNGNSLESLLN